MGAILCEFESRPPHSISHKETSKEVSFFVMSLRAHRYNWHFWLVKPAQRKIPVVFNCGQKIASISGRHLVKPVSGQKNGLFYGRHRHKAGGTKFLEPGVFRTTSMNCPFLWLRMPILLWQDSFRLLSSKKCRFYWRRINQQTFASFFLIWPQIWAQVLSLRGLRNTLLRRSSFRICNFA